MDNKNKFYLSYEEYVKMHNKYTKKFLSTIGPFIGYIRNRNYQKEEESLYRIFIAMIKALDIIDDNSYVLLEKCIDSKDFNLISTSSYSSADMEYFFEKLFGVVDNIEHIYTLSPISYINRFIFLYYNHPYFSSRIKLSENKIETLKQEQLCRDEKDIGTLLIEYYKFINKDIIPYINQVAYIFNYLKENSLYNMETIRTLSYFLAFFTFDDSKCKIKFSKLCCKYFEEYGLPFEKIMEILKIKNLSVDMTNEECVLILNAYFNSFKSRDNLDLICLFKNLILKGNISILNGMIFSKSSFDISILDEIHTKLKDNNNILSISEIEIYQKKLSHSVLDYLSECAKIIKLLQSKTSFDNKIIKDNKLDIFVISQMLYAYYKKLPLSDFLKFKGITINDLSDIFDSKLEDYNSESIDITDEEYILLFSRIVKQFKNKVNNITVDSLQNLLFSYEVFNRIIHYKSNEDISTDLFKEYDKYLTDKKNKEIEELSSKLLYGLSYDVYNYIKILTNTFLNIANNNLTEKDKIIVSIIYSIYYSDKFKDYFDSIGFDISKVLSFYNTKIFYFFIENCDVDLSILEKYFMDYIYGGNNKDKKREEITVESVISNLFNSELNRNIKIIELLNKMGVDIDLFNNLEQNINIFNQIKIKKYLEFIKSNEECFTFFRYAYSISSILEKNVNISSDEIETISILLTLFTYYKNVQDNEEEYICDYFYRVCIDKKLLLEKYLIDENELDNIDISNISEEDIYSKYESMIKKLFDGKDSNFILMIIRNLFESDENKIISSLINDEIVFSSLVNNLFNVEKKYTSVSSTDLLKQLKRFLREIDEIAVSDIVSLYDLVNDIDRKIYILSGAISQIVNSINSQSNDDKSNGIISALDNIYIDTPRNMFARIFNSKNVIREINLDSIEFLENLLDDNIKYYARKKVQIENVEEIIYIYLQIMSLCNNKYIELLNDLDVKMTVGEFNDLDFITKRKLIDILDRLKFKVSSYEASSKINKIQLSQLSDYVRVYRLAAEAQMITKNTIIPMIRLSSLIIDSSNASRETVLITNLLRNLCANLIRQNISGAKEDLERLSMLDMPDDMRVILDSTNIELISTEDELGNAKKLNN